MRRKSDNPSRTTALAASLVGLMFLSCSPSSPSDPGQTQGQIQVTVSTSGTGVPASFTVSLDGGSPQSISPDGSVTFGSLTAGNYTVELSVPSNCTISGSAERSVGVQEGSTSTVAYSASCSAVPTGAIGVTTSTTGSPPDPDGYTVSVDGGAARAIGVSDNLLIPDLGLGDHELELSGVAANCLVQGANPRTVSVSENQTTQTEFEVTCSATSGRIDVTVMTTGQAQDADGYDVELDGGAVTRPVAANGSAEFTGVEQGEHTLALSGVASNCTVTGDNPVSVEVVAGEAVDASFTVECEATTGGLEVTATTTGDELDSNGYAVSVDGSLEQAIGVNGSTTFADLPPGDHDVELTGVAGNCAVGGTNPRTVAVVAGQTASTNFDVTCSSTVGSVEVSVTTTGDAIDADGYSVVLDGGVSTRLVDANDTAVFGGLAPGEHTLDLGNVAANCTVTSDNPATAEVTAGAQTDVAFTVECEELTGDIQVNMSTTGSSLDSDGYTVSLDGGSALSVASNGSRTFSDVVIGEHEIEIGDVASNCSVQGGSSRDVTVNENQTTQVDFDVECSATAGAIEVTVTTSGEDQDDSYFVVLLESGDSQLVDGNDTATFGGLTPDEYDVELQNVEDNCEVGGDNPRTVDVVAGETTAVSFAVDCTSTTGSIFAEVSTLGVDEDPDGYTFTLDGGTPRSVEPDGSTTYSGLSPGNYDVGIDASTVADNCTVNEANPQTQSVTAANTSNVSFTVTCEEITGSVQVNMTTGGDEPDTGYTATLSGGLGSQSVTANGSTTFTDVPTGNYTVTISGIAPNCTDDDGDDQEAVTVMEDMTASANFSYTCTSTTGSIFAEVSTSGTDLDPDGYTFTLDGGTPRPVGIDGSTTYSGLVPDDYNVGIDETTVADNCGVNEANPQTQSVTAANTSNVSFTVTCEEITGSIMVTTTTTGTPDPDGYLVSLDGGPTEFIDDATSVTFSGLSPAGYDVLLSGLDATCVVVDPPSNPATATVVAGDTVPVDFNVDCA